MDVRIRGYFSKPKGIREQKGWGNTGLYQCFPSLWRGKEPSGPMKGVEIVDHLNEYWPLEK
jgi:hypothetical protein